MVPLHVPKLGVRLTGGGCVSLPSPPPDSTSTPSPTAPAAPARAYFLPEPPPVRSGRRPTVRGGGQGWTAAFRFSSRSCHRATMNLAASLPYRPLWAASNVALSPPTPTSDWATG